jgi:hypothetical protein
MFKNTATELYLDYEIIIIKLTVVEVARGRGLGTSLMANMEMCGNNLPLKGKTLMNGVHVEKGPGPFNSQPEVTLDYSEANGWTVVNLQPVDG